MLKLEHINFIYSGVNVEYNYSYSCQEYGCDTEGICRCGSIHDEYVESVDISLMSEKIYDEFFGNSNGKAAERNNTINMILYGVGKDMDIYCIDRILRSSKIWESHLWNIEIMSGYYGQEIEEVKINSIIASKLEEDMLHAFSLATLTEKVEFLLKLEYGKILPELNGCRYEYEVIDMENLIFGSKNHHSKVKSKELDFYSDRGYKGIRGIVKKVENSNKLKVIDGYHRLSSTKFPKAKVIVAYKD
jgi:hypothetical protein